MAPKKRSAYDIRRAQILKERRKKLNLKMFKPEEKSICGRAAEFLNWAADRYPSSIITYEEVAQAVFSLGRIQDRRSAAVKSVRSAMSPATKILMTHYKRTLISLRGVGVRASVDDVDILQGTLTQNVERHKQTANKLQKTAALINPVQLAKQLETLGGDPVVKQGLVDLSEWLANDLNKYLKTLKQPRTERALLPPPPPE